MPSPIGHVLAGFTAALGTDQHRPTSWSWQRLTLVCGFLAAAPDLDLLVRGFHRTATHSLTAAVLVTVAAALVTRYQSGRVDWRVAVTCGVAYASHLLLDWLGVDPGKPAGIQLLWPFSTDYFISGIPLFEHTERYRPFRPYAIMVNLLAVAREVVVIGPVFLLMLVRWRRRRHLG